MAPAHAPIPARRALLWSTLPALAAFFGLLWFRRRRRRAPPPPPPPSSSLQQCVTSSSVTPSPPARAAPASDGPPVDADDDSRSSPPPLQAQVEKQSVAAEPLARALTAAPVAPTPTPREAAASQEHGRNSSSIGASERPLAAEPPAPSALPPSAPAQEAFAQKSEPPEGPASRPAAQEGAVLPTRQVSESSRGEEVFNQTTAEVCSPTREESNSCRSSDRVESSRTEVSETVASSDRVPSKVCSAKVQREVYSSQEFEESHSLMQESEEVIDRKVIKKEECAKTITEEVEVVCEKQVEVLKSVLDCRTEVPESTVRSINIERQRLLATQSIELVAEGGGEADIHSLPRDGYSNCIDLRKEDFQEGLTQVLEEASDPQDKEVVIKEIVVEKDAEKAQGTEKVQETRLRNIDSDMIQIEAESGLTASRGISSGDKQDSRNVSLSEQKESGDSLQNQREVVNRIEVEEVQNPAHITQADSVEISFASLSKTEVSKEKKLEQAGTGSENAVQEVTLSVEDSKEVFQSKEDSKVTTLDVVSNRDSCGKVASNASSIEVELNQIPNHTNVDEEGLARLAEDIKYLKNSALKERNSEAKEVTTSVEQTKVKKSTEAEKENTSSENQIDSKGALEVPKEAPSMKTREDNMKATVQPVKASNSIVPESIVAQEVGDTTESLGTPKSKKKASKSKKSKKDGESPMKSLSPEPSMKSQKTETSQRIGNSVEVPMKVIDSVEEPKKVVKSVEEPKKITSSSEESTKQIESLQESKKAIISTEKSKKVNSTDDSMKVNTSAENAIVVFLPVSSKKAKKSKKARNPPEEVTEYTSTTVVEVNTKNNKEQSSQNSEQYVQSSSNVTVDTETAPKETAKGKARTIKKEAAKVVEVCKKAPKETPSPAVANSQTGKQKGKKTDTASRSKAKESTPPPPPATEQSAKEEEATVAAVAATAATAEKTVPEPETKTATEAESSEQLTKAEAHELARLIQRQLTGTKCCAGDTTSAPSQTKSEAAATAMEALHLETPGLEAGVQASPSRAPSADLKSGDAPGAADSASAVHHHHHNHLHHHHHHQQQRDSANHSPAEGMLASPRACYLEDAASENSSDSGKGCSDAPTPPSRTPASGSSVSGDGAASHATAGDADGQGESSSSRAAAAGASAVPAACVYEFVLPQHLVGRLIGRHGCYVHQIKARTNAAIFIKRHPDTPRLKICAVEGTPTDVDSALEMIRQKFPEKRYPHVSLEQVCFVPASVASASLPVVPVLPDCLRLPLVEGVTNDVTICSLVSPAHFFLQQPTHPTFPALVRMGAIMDYTYDEEVMKPNSEPPPPPVPMVQPGIIVITPSMGSWFRAEVVSVDPESETCQIRYVDYGGYDVQPYSALRQIRTDFMTLPFQATECYLANIVCKNEEGWTTEAMSLMEQMTAGQVVQAQVCGYCEDNTPAVSLYAMVGSRVISIGEELVARGFAKWWEPVDG